MYPNHYYPVWRTILRKFDRYILSQLMVMFGFFALVLVSVYWVNNTVKVFDRLIFRIYTTQPTKRRPQCLADRGFRSGSLRHQPAVVRKRTDRHAGHRVFALEAGLAGHSIRGDNRNYDVHYDPHACASKPATIARPRD